jgi:hypothetical protein
MLQTILRWPGYQMRFAPKAQTVPDCNLTVNVRPNGSGRSADFRDGEVFTYRVSFAIFSHAGDIVFEAHDRKVGDLEAMSVTDDIRKAIIARASSMEIGKIAMNQGMKTLRHAALEKVREGLSTLEQTLVVTAGH